MVWEQCTGLACSGETGGSGYVAILAAISGAKLGAVGGEGTDA